MRNVREAGGNPFYIEELIKMLMEKRGIGGGVGSWSLPPTLAGVLQARLDGLPGAERTVTPELENGRYRLRTLSLRGGEFVRVASSGLSQLLKSLVLFAFAQ